MGSPSAQPTAGDAARRPVFGLAVRSTVSALEDLVQVELRHNPSFTVARCVLTPNEQVRVEGGAMIAHSAGVVLEAKAEGGVMAGLKRSVLGGGSFFVTTYTAPAQGGWVDVAGMLPGDTVSIDVTPDRPFFLRRGSWIANSHGVQIDTQWGGMANLFGGEGGFGFRASGQGEALVSIYGAVDIIDLEDGEQVTIDTGHVVAYDLAITVPDAPRSPGPLHPVDEVRRGLGLRLPRSGTRAAADPQPRGLPAMGCRGRAGPDTSRRPRRHRRFASSTADSTHLRSRDKWRDR